MEKPKLALLNPAQELDELEALLALYVSLTGKEPTHQEISEAKLILASE